MSFQTVNPSTTWHFCFYANPVCVQLPEMRALKWDTKIHDPDRVTDGYWFVAPYGQISPEHPTQKYEQYQIGPYIYDNNGVCFWI